MALEYSDQKVNTGTITVANPAAAVTVTLGWQPRYVKAVNINDLKIYEWFEGMDAAAYLLTANHADTQIAVGTTNGITVSATGVTFGTTICDTAADVVRWIAVR